MTTAAHTQGVVGRAHAFALGQPVARVAKIVFAGIAVMAVFGIFQRLGWGFSLFDFDGEGKPPAVWSGLVLLGAAAGAGLVSLDDEYPRRWLALGALFAFMGLDEMLTIHETTANLFGDVDWIKLWSPLIIAGGIGWLFVTARVWHQPRERALMIAGAAAWFVSQVLEQVESNPQEGRVHGYGALSSAEEILEVTGSALFLLAMLGTLHVLAARRRAGGTASA